MYVLGGDGVESFFLPSFFSLESSTFIMEKIAFSSFIGHIRVLGLSLKNKIQIHNHYFMLPSML